MSMLSRCLLTKNMCGGGWRFILEATTYVHSGLISAASAAAPKLETLVASQETWLAFFLRRRRRWWMRWEINICITQVYSRNVACCAWGTCGHQVQVESSVIRHLRIAWCPGADGHVSTAPRKQQRHIHERDWASIGVHLMTPIGSTNLSSRKKNPPVTAKCWILYTTLISSFSAQSIIFYSFCGSYISLLGNIPCYTKISLVTLISHVWNLNFTCDTNITRVKPKFHLWQISLVTNLSRDKSHLWQISLVTNLSCDKSHSWQISLVTNLTHDNSRSWQISLVTNLACDKSRLWQISHATNLMCDKSHIW